MTIHDSTRLYTNGQTKALHWCYCAYALGNTTNQVYRRLFEQCLGYSNIIYYIILINFLIAGGMSNGRL